MMILGLRSKYRIGSSRLGQAWLCLSRPKVRLGIRQCKARLGKIRHKARLGPKARLGLRLA